MKPESSDSDKTTASPNDDGNSTAKNAPKIPPEIPSSETPPPKIPSPKIPQCRDCEVPLSILGEIPFLRRSDSLLLGLFAAFAGDGTGDLEPFPIDVFRCPQCCRIELYDLDASLPGATK